MNIRSIPLQTSYMSNTALPSLIRCVHGFVRFATHVMGEVEGEKKLIDFVTAPVIRFVSGLSITLAGFNSKV